VNSARLLLLGALLSSATAVAAGSACSSSSTKNPPGDAGRGTGSGSGSGTGTGTGSGSGSGTGTGTGTGSGTGTSTGTGTGSGSGACPITPGTYEVTNTIADGGTVLPACPPANSLTTYPPVDAGISDTGIACTSTTNACTTTTACSGTVSGTYLYSSSTSETVTGGIPSGSSSYSIEAADGAPISNLACAYTFVWVPADAGMDAGMDQ
jgi:hypothetical protein